MLHTRRADILCFILHLHCLVYSMASWIQGRIQSHVYEVETLTLVQPGRLSGLCTLECRLLLIMRALSCFHIDAMLLPDIAAVVASRLISESSALWSSCKGCDLDTASYSLAPPADLPGPP